MPRLAVVRGAAAHPRMAAPVDHAGQRLSGAGAGALHRPSRRRPRRARRATQQRFLMQSNGGVMPFAAAIAGGTTVHTLLSGPAAGAQASAHLGRAGRPARPRHARHGRHQRRHRLHRGRRAAGGDRRRRRAPPARCAGARHDDDLGRRRLDRLDRPRADSSTSARRAPAPIRARPATAAAAREPTVTDADLVCGFLNPDYFLGGAQRLDAGAAQRGARGAHRRAAEDDACSRRPPASAASSTCAWPTRCGCSPPGAASI